MTQLLPVTTPFEMPLTTPFSKLNSIDESSSVQSATVLPFAKPLVEYGQQVMRFFHEGEGALSEMTSYDIRQHLRPIALEIGTDIMEMSVTQSERAVTIYALTPKASFSMAAQPMRLMKFVANLANRVLEMEHEKLMPSISYTSDRWLHVIPKFVVATKKEKDWTVWRDEKLSDDLAASMKQSILDGISQAFQPWMKKSENAPVYKLSGLFEIIDQGRPMIIVQNGPGPNFMARLGVKFISSQRIEGALFIGKYNYLGMGRVMRVTELNK